MCCSSVKYTYIPTSYNNILYVIINIEKNSLNIYYFLVHDRVSCPYYIMLNPNYYFSFSY